VKTVWTDMIHIVGLESYKMHRSNWLKNILKLNCSKCIFVMVGKLVQGFHHVTLNCKLVLCITPLNILLEDKRMDILLSVHVNFMVSFCNFLLYNFNMMCSIDYIYHKFLFGTQQIMRVWHEKSKCFEVLTVTVRACMGGRGGGLVWMGMCLRALCRKLNPVRYFEPVV
jgi:hypothetical protein